MSERRAPDDCPPCESERAKERNPRERVEALSTEVEAQRVMARRVEIVTECEHGSDGGCFSCEGGSRRVLGPGEAERIIVRVLSARRPCAEADDVAILDAAVAIMDALAGGEQP